MGLLKHENRLLGHKMVGGGEIFQAAKWALASEKALCSVEFVSYRNYEYHTCNCDSTAAGQDILVVDFP